jgi:hypothetical protein
VARLVAVEEAGAARWISGFLRGKLIGLWTILDCHCHTSSSSIFYYLLPLYFAFCFPLFINSMSRLVLLIS